jgi:soluble lytic murein transglycosylase-like protein
MSPRQLPLVGALVLLMTTASATVARAQIYYWRDPSGAFVLSDKPKDPDAKTYIVQRSHAIKTTQPLGKRAAQFDPVVQEQSDLHGVDANLVRAVIQAESAYDPRAVSVKGAMGLMQLMPATAAEYGVADAFNPVENIRAGVAYLKSLLTKYRENVELALAAYNAGPTAVKKYGGTVPPYRETKKYVQKVQGAVENARPPAPRVYRTIEIVDGRPVPRYSSKPSAGAQPVDTNRGMK